MALPRDTGGLGGLPPGTTPASPPAGDPTFNPGVGRTPAGGTYLRQSASYGRPYPIVYGTAAVQAVPLLASVGYLDNELMLDGATLQAMRTAWAAYALAVGPVTAIEAIFYEKRRYASATGGGALEYKYLSKVVGGAWPNPPELFLGNGSTTAWSGFPDPTQWKELATFRCRELGVPGGRGQVPELRALVRGLYASTSNAKRNDGVWTRYDAKPGDVIRDLLENTTYGLGLAAGTVVTAVGADGAAASSYDRYCEQSGWYIALAIDASVSVAEVVAQILAATNSVGFWSGPSFKIIPLGDTAVGTYTPVLTAVGLGEDDWVAPEGQDAIRVTRRSWADCYNVIPVEYSADTALRDSELVPTEAQDQASIATYGLRRSPDTVRLPCIRSKSHALEISGILARQSVYHRSLFEFTISARQGAALEPGDLVALTHAPMGLTDRLARVERIEASPEGGTYRVEAREWVTGATVSVTYTPAGPDGLATTPTAGADPYATSAAALASIAAISSDSVFSASEGPGALMAWNDLAASSSDLVAKAAAVGVSSTNWTDKLGALGTYLNGGTTWTSGTPSWLVAPFADRTIVPATWQGYWSDAHTARVWLQNAITAAKITTGGAAGDVNAGLVPITRDRTTIGNTANLWPNPTSEVAPPAGADTSTAEWFGRTAVGGGSYAGDYCRELTSTTGADKSLSHSVAAMPGESYSLEAYGYRVSGSGSASLYIAFRDKAGSVIGSFNQSNVHSAASWAKLSVQATAPANTVSVDFYLSSLANGTVTVSRFDSIVAKRMVEGDTGIVADSIQTADYAYTGTKGASDEVATRGARIRNSTATDNSGSELPAIVVSKKGIKIGTKTIDQTWLSGGRVCSGVITRSASNVWAISDSIGLGGGTPSVVSSLELLIPTPLSVGTKVIVTGQGFYSTGTPVHVLVTPSYSSVQSGGSIRVQLYGLTNASNALALDTSGLEVLFRIQVVALETTF